MSSSQSPSPFSVLPAVQQAIDQLPSALQAPLNQHLQQHHSLAVIPASLMQVLIEAMPAERKAEAPETLMNGPVINAVGRDDVVSSQEQVDDLLESLGF